MLGFALIMLSSVELVSGSFIDRIGEFLCSPLVDILHVVRRHLTIHGANVDLWQ